MIFSKSTLALTSVVVSAVASPLSVPPRNVSSLSRRDDQIWCGIVQQSEASGSFNKVSGEWTIPEISLRDGQTNDGGFEVPVWVGIDGYGCDSLLQAGTTTFINSDGSQTTSFWTEWFPDPPVYLEDFGASTGEQVGIQISASSSTEGAAILKNISTGQEKTVDLTAPSGKPLCNKSLEWIIEVHDGGLANFPDISVADVGDDQAGNAQGGSPITATHSGQNICSASVDSNGNIIFAPA